MVTKKPLSLIGSYIKFYSEQLQKVIQLEVVVFKDLQFTLRVSKEYKCENGQTYIL